jgi:predicted transcriptional regulator
MTERTLHLRVESEEAFAGRAKAAFKAAARGDDLPERDHLSFQDFSIFLSALSPKRWELLGHLHKGGPTSIRALAAAAGRDYKSVHGDLARLMELGLVAKRSDGRVEAPYDRVIAELTFGASLAA